MTLYVVTAVSTATGLQQAPPTVLPERDIAARCWADWVVERMADPFSVDDVRGMAEAFITDESENALRWTLAVGLVYELFTCVVPNVGLIYEKRSKR